MTTPKLFRLKIDFNDCYTSLTLQSAHLELRRKQNNPIVQKQMFWKTYKRSKNNNCQRKLSAEIGRGVECPFKHLEPFPS